jgi:hypothetical protein
VVGRLETPYEERNCVIPIDELGIAAEVEAGRSV